MPPFTIKSFMPDVDALEAMAPEARGRLLLQFLHYANRTLLPLLHRANLLQPQHFLSYEPNERARIMTVVSETWDWLELHGFLAAIPGQQSGWVFITPQGKQLADAATISAYTQAALFPEALLHPAISDCARPDFVRGDYPRAVFQAFKEVEIAVREATGDHFMDATPLMRKAFARGRGALTDPNESEEEQQGLLLLFAGAMAYFRRAPDKPRPVMVAEQALEMIMFASHLRRIVDQRLSSNSS